MAAFAASSQALHHGCCACKTSSCPPQIARRGLLSGAIMPDAPAAHQQPQAARPTLCCPPPPDSEGTTLYDLTFDARAASLGSGWVSWASVVPQLSIPPGASFTDIIVPTKDSTRCGHVPLLPASKWAAAAACMQVRLVAYTQNQPSTQIPHTTTPPCRVTFLLDVALQHNIPLLLVGPSGTGKSTYVGRHMQQGLSQAAWQPVFITLSARTTAGMAQEQVRWRHARWAPG